MSLFEFLDKESDITDIIWHDHKRFAPVAKLVNQALRGKSELSCGERELISAFVSGLNACEFCLGTHQAVAQRFGVEPQLLSSLLDDIDSAKISPRLKPIFHYAKKLTLASSEITTTDAKNILEQGWQERTLEDVILIVSLFNFMNRVIDGYGIKGSQGNFEFAGDKLHQYGYGVPWFVIPMIKKQRSKYLADFIDQSDTLACES